MHQDKDRADDSLLLEESVLAIVFPHVTTIPSSQRFVNSKRLNSNRGNE